MQTEPSSGLGTGRQHSPPTMTSELTRRERMQRALWRQPVDRLPVQTNYTAAMGQKLAAHLACAASELPTHLNNHLLRVDFTHRHFSDPGGTVRYDWWGAGWGTQTEGYWHALAPLADSASLTSYPWPDPHAPGLLDEAKEAILADRGQHFIVPNLGFALFERAWSLRGFDALLLDLIDRPAWVEGLLERIADIQASLAQRFVALGVDGGYFGDDYGAQRGLLFSPRLWRQMIKPRLARLFAVFRNAGLPVILHSDGDLWPILPDLLDIGLTCLNPVQPEVLDHSRLRRDFGQHLSFYGGISTQEVLPNAAPAEVRTATLACIQSLAPDGTGLILGPSHRMQSDIPVENVVAMLEAFPR
jgi:uroporphyrinogen decarboxylase